MGRARRARVALFTLLCLLAGSISGGRAEATRAVAAGQHHACIFDHLALRTARGVCRPRARAYPPHIATAAERAIYDSSLTFGVPYSVLLTIGKCESALNPHASNGSHFGLFQFAPPTFRRAIHRMLVETGIKARSYWNALDSAYAAGYLFAVGDSPDWTCERAPTPPPG